MSCDYATNLAASYVGFCPIAGKIVSGDTRELYWEHLAEARGVSYGDLVSDGEVIPLDLHNPENGLLAFLANPPHNATPQIVEELWQALIKQKPRFLRYDSKATLPDLSRLRSVETVVFYHDAAESLTDEVAQKLATLPNLNRVTLAVGSLTQAIDNLGKHCGQKVKVLTLQRDQEATIPPAIARFTALDTLKIDDCPYTALPDTIAALPLTSLEVRWTPLRALPDTLAESSITELSIANAQFKTQIPPVLQRMSLNKLTIRDTGRWGDMTGVSFNRSLTSLHLSGNGITDAGDFWQHSPYLSSLDLSNNPLTKLPIPPNVHSLRRANFSNTEATALPPEYGNLEALNVLHLGGSPIRKFPAVMVAPLHLLDLRGIKNPPIELIGRIRSLKELRVDMGVSPKLAGLVSELPALTRLELPSIPKKSKLLDRAMAANWETAPYREVTIPDSNYDSPW
jgi:Leucine-rich repeat (LRR) protein